MMTNQEAIRLIRNLLTMCIFTDAYGEPIDSNAYYEAVDMAISALQEQDSKTRKICDTCKHDPPSKKFPCVDCDMRDPADRWEPKDVPGTNVGGMISRQAAIDAVEKESQVDGAYGYMDTKSIVDLLNDLPSANPDRCDTCRFVYYPKEANNNDE